MSDLIEAARSRLLGPAKEGQQMKMVAVFLAAGLIACFAGIAGAVPLTPFRYEDQAQRHCPDDTVVWLDFRKGLYYTKGQRRYGVGFDGGFVCRGEARDSRYRRSLGVR